MRKRFNLFIFTVMVLGIVISGSSHSSFDLQESLSEDSIENIYSVDRTEANDPGDSGIG
ncbi:hypothetical protein [Halobacillus yeomjeoni]|uniref:Uncharacterized protein n=1 Tax=Halobacillus yeomjeoni TaxID=311194 RepID=A0A931MWT9_9BACI|nr:hypothetical protein [Halobacillus yeomjeoni]MBH0231599.1 hypothetical protein [Halobacillus yeomjeoni]